MNCLFPSLNACEEAVETAASSCFDQHDSVIQGRGGRDYFSREQSLLRRSGRKPMDRKNKRRSRSTSAERVIRKFVDEITIGEFDLFNGRIEARDDMTINSYIYSNHGNRTRLTNDEGGSRASGDTDWTEQTKKTKQSWFSSGKSSFAQHNRKNYGIIEDVASPTNSVGAVRPAKGGRQGPKADDFSPFDYIRQVAHKQFANHMKDPPSDKSMVTSNSIRAEDAGSAFFKKGILPTKEQLQQKQRQNQLAEQILRQRQLQMKIINDRFEP